MKKALVLLLFVFSLPFAKAVGDDNVPSYYERQLVYMNGVDASCEEARYCGMTYQASYYTWIQTTTICAINIPVVLTCNNNIKDEYKKSHIAIAYPHSYQNAESGYWSSPHVWVDEYINPSSPFEEWSFSAYLSGVRYGYEVVVFRCYNDTVYRYI